MSAFNPHVRCGAKNRKGAPCPQRPVPGSKRCHWHGGATPCGPALPQFKHGRYSRLLSEAGIGAAFEEAMDDPALGSLRKAIALCEERIAALMTRLKSGEHADSWTAALTTCRGAMQAEDLAQMRVRLEQLEAVLLQGVVDDATWAQLFDAFEQRRRLTDTEGKNAERMHRILTAEQAKAFMAAVLGSLQKHVADRGALAAIGADFRALLSRRGLPPEVA